MLPAFCEHTLKITTPGTKTVHGSNVDDWAPGAVTVRTIDYCWVDSKSSDEDNRRRDTTREGFDILIPAEAEPPTSADRLEHPLAAGFFRVQGSAMPVASSDGALDHYFVFVERWTTRG